LAKNFILAMVTVSFFGAGLVKLAGLIDEN
jgi:hypothetical protein